MSEVKEIARNGIIGEQNRLIAAAYEALLAVRDDSLPRDEIEQLACSAIEAIESWRQKRDPDGTDGRDYEHG